MLEGRAKLEGQSQLGERARLVAAGGAEIEAEGAAAKAPGNITVVSVGGVKALAALAKRAVGARQWKVANRCMQLTSDLAATGAHVRKLLLKASLPLPPTSSTALGSSLQEGEATRGEGGSGASEEGVEGSCSCLRRVRRSVVGRSDV